MMDFENPVEQTLWEYLAVTEKPIVLYGMGDGAVKIMNVLADIGVKPAEIMASDEFVRGHSFLGYKVKKLSEIEAQYEEFIILVCFGSNLPDVMQRIYDISEKHELYAPNVPVVGDGLFSREFYYENRGKIEQVYKLLADEKSKKAYENIILYKLTGKLDWLREIETPIDEAYDLLRLSKEETYVDLGAYDGDTIVEFLGITQGRFKKIFAMEPDTKNYEKLRRRLYMFGSYDLEAHNTGAWDKECVEKLSSRSGRNSRIGGGKREREVKMLSVDKMLKGGEATLIKYDVEGSEKQALDGTRETIKAHKPKLMVAVYHRNEDIFEIPLQIHSLHRFYKIYFRHHEYVPDWDTNIYCI